MLPIIILIAVNLLGYILKSNDLDRYIIILGFRFHLITTLPLLAFFYKKINRNIIGYIKQFNFQRGSYTFLVIFISSIVFPAVLYFVNLSKFTDPDFLYEFGISSVVDYPVYLVWNLPQLLIFIIYLLCISEGKKLKFFLVFFPAILSFTYEFVPLYENEIILNEIYILILACLLLSILILRINIYLCSVTLYTIFWSYILMFGNVSRTLLNLLLAKNYTSWEGILIPVKSIDSYTFIIQLGLAVVLFLPALLLNSKKKKIVI